MSNKMKLMLILGVMIAGLSLPLNVKASNGERIIFSPILHDGGGPIPTHCPTTICKPSPTNPPKIMKTDGAPPPTCPRQLQEQGKCPNPHFADGGRIPMCNPYGAYCQANPLRCKNGFCGPGQVVNWEKQFHQLD